jgi:simple sugar transport system ATP-binding protein
VRTGRAPAGLDGREHVTADLPAAGVRAAEDTIEARDIWKAFGHVEALRGASLRVSRGEIVAVVGDNGAGKSTLMKVMCGALPPDSGELSLMGKSVNALSIRDAQHEGIETVYQDLALAPDLTVSENIFLGHDLIGTGWRRYLRVLARRQMESESRAALAELGIDMRSTSNSVSSLSGGQRQAIAIARAVRWVKAFIFMDEPTAALGTRQTEIVCNTIRTAAQRGIGILVISHDMPRMLELADRIVVLRHGVVVADWAARGMSISQIVGAMLGEQVHRA